MIETKELKDELERCAEPKIFQRIVLVALCEATFNASMVAAEAPWALQSRPAITLCCQPANSYLAD